MAYSSCVLQPLLVFAALTGKAFGQTSSSTQCLTTINALRISEQLTTNFTVPRTYILCPNKTYYIGYLDFNYDIQNGDGMIPLRENLHLKCGDSGSRENMCFISGGDIQIDGTDRFGLGNAPMNNVIIEGVTFFSPEKYTFWGNRAGDVSFIDCEFRESTKATTTVLAEFADNNDTGAQLAVRFAYSSFEDNRYFGAPSYPAVVVGNTIQTTLTFDNVQFIGNDMKFNNTMYETYSYLIESAGDTTVSMSCFKNNSVGVSPVVVYGTPNTSFSQNYGLDSSGAKCSFISQFTTDSSYEAFNPGCSDFDATTCLATGTRPPTGAPSMAPTAPTVGPTANPSVSPSNIPTKVPSDAPSRVPTVSPAPTITPRPTSLTQPPSMAPSVAPSNKPSFPAATAAPQPPSDGTSGASGSSVVSLFGCTAVLTGAIYFLWL